MRVTIPNVEALKPVKKALARITSGIGSGHLSEILASGLSYRTSISLQTALKAGTIHTQIDEAAAVARQKELASDGVMPPCAITRALSVGLPDSITTLDVNAEPPAEPAEPKWLASAKAGSEEHAGHHYSVMYGNVSRLSDGTFRVTVEAESGIQGNREPSDEDDLEGEGPTIERAVDAIADEVMDLEYTTEMQRRQFLRDLVYEAEDALYSDIEWAEIAEAEAGNRGYPGQGYCIIEAAMNQSDKGRFEIVVTAQRGRNQGRLEPHREARLAVRGHSIDDVVDEIESDVMDLEFLAGHERAQLLRDIRSAAKDFLEPESEAEEVARVEAGNRAHPGHPYSIARAVVTRFTQDDEDKVRLTVHAERGSNQGHLEPLRKADLAVVGDSIQEAIRELRGDVLALTDFLRRDELESLLADVEAEAEAALADTPAPGSR